MHLINSKYHLQVQMCHNNNLVNKINSYKNQEWALISVGIKFNQLRAARASSFRRNRQITFSKTRSKPNKTQTLSNLQLISNQIQIQIFSRHNSKQIRTFSKQIQTFSKQIRTFSKLHQTR
mgnify:CR=1 FL=1